MAPDISVKVILLGNANVGKTALTYRFLNYKYNEDTSTTVGCSFVTRVLRNSSNIPIKMAIWDTAGSERYRSMTTMFYRDSKAAILCFDLSDRLDFENLNYWITELREIEPNCKIYLCGCKKDLVIGKDTPIKSSHLISFSSANNLIYCETSSKNGDGVEELFQRICNDISDSPGFLTNTMKRNIILNSTNIPKGNKSCGAC